LGQWNPCHPVTMPERGIAQLIRASRSTFPAPRPDAEARLRLLAVVIALVYAAHFTGAVLGAPRTLVSLAFVLFVLPVPFLGWWAYTRAAANLKRPFLFLSLAASLWLSGTLVWYGYYFAGGRVIPEPPGPWDAFFVPALLLVIAAIVVALRSLISFRLAALDACVLIAAGVTMAAPFVRHSIERGVSAESLFTLNRPLLSIVTLMLLVSALLGSWEGLPRSIALVGLGEIPLTIGNLIYGYAAVQGMYTQNKWANLGWALGGAIFTLGALVVILGLDRPVRLPLRRRIPNHPAGSRAVLLLTLAALALTLGVAGYGLTVDARGLALVGLIASVMIGVAMALRARAAIRSAENAYSRLDGALADAERARDDLADANEDLARANAQIQAVHVAYADLLNLTDEQTHGRVRELIEDTGGGLAEFLEEEMERQRRR
jgi:hypothetical protein